MCYILCVKIDQIKANDIVLFLQDYGGVKRGEFGYVKKVEDMALVLMSHETTEDNPYIALSEQTLERAVEYNRDTFEDIWENPKKILAVFMSVS